MTTAGLHQVIRDRGVRDGVSEETAFMLADTLVRASRLGHNLDIYRPKPGEPNDGHRFVCARCGGLIAWMPGYRLVHRGPAAMAPCVHIIRMLVAEGVATTDQREWLAGQEASRG